MNTTFKDLAGRALRTFVTSFAAVFVLGTVGLPAAALVGLITALFGFGMNVLGIAPASIPGRATGTFLQTFLATWAVSGYELSVGVFLAAGAAALNALVNFVRTTA